MRAEMPVAERWAYLDHAAVAPVSGPAQRALERWIAEAAQDGDARWPDWRRRVEETRNHAAQLIGASNDEIALVTSTTHGINLVAEGIRWREGDNIVVLADEYPSNVYPWMNQQQHGVETRLVETDFGRLDLDKLREACDSRTRVVSASWVGFSTGYRQRWEAIGEIAHSCGAMFFLDAIQGLGVLPIDVADSPVDFLAADGHKWMLGPEGAGMAYLRKDRLEDLRPHGVGWGSVVGAHNFGVIDFRLKEDATRYEGGTANMAGLQALGASLAWFAEQDAGHRLASILQITDYLCERLASIDVDVLTHRAIEPDGHDPCSGIVTALPRHESPEALRKRCLEANVVVSCRGGGLRMSLHAYNNEEDVDRLIEVLVPSS